MIYEMRTYEAMPGKLRALGAAIGETALKEGFGLVGGGSGGAALIRGELGDAPEDGGDFAGAPKIFDAPRFEGVGAGRALQR